jgi:hypothetical protein
MLVGAVGRNPDGSIDYGFYRRRAARLRRAKMRESLVTAGKFVRPLVAVAIIVTAILVMPTQDPQTTRQSADVASAGPPQFSRIVN